MDHDLLPNDVLGLSLVMHTGDRSAMYAAKPTTPMYPVAFIEHRDDTYWVGLSTAPEVWSYAEAETLAEAVKLVTA